MNPLQHKLCDMLGYFHSFCEKHQLRYYILQGTLLGAVRHQGFIPWDDDMDVGMPISDYLRFIDLAKDLPNSPYIVESPLCGKKDFMYTFSKLYDTRTTLIENQDPPIKRGIYLDIFPLCGFGNTLQEAQHYVQRINQLQKIKALRIMAFRPGRKWYKNLLIRATKIMPMFCLRKYLLPKILNLTLKKDFDSYKYVGNPACIWGTKEVMPIEYFGKPTPYTFEKMVVYGPENADKYLTYVYGNWQQLPPAEKQRSHHSSLYLSLTEPYQNTK